MGQNVTIGGERLGAGKRMKAYLHGYERSTHNLSYLWRSSMACGTLVPFLVEVALPGDTFDINLDVDVLTHPTIGPLFGDYKIQLDTFIAPIRLYQGKLHMNMLEIGLKMSDIKLPLVELTARGIDPNAPLDNQQINPSSIFSYLGVRGLGVDSTNSATQVLRHVNAVPHLMYWEIYKQYYSNKQEKIGAVIHKDPNDPGLTMVAADIIDTINGSAISLIPPNPSPYPTTGMESWTKLVIQCTGLSANVQIENIILSVEEYESGGVPAQKLVPASEYWMDWEINTDTNTIIGTNTTLTGQIFRGYGTISYNGTNINTENLEPKIITFPLANIDNMKLDILTWATQPNAFIYSNSANAPYGLPMQQNLTTQMRSLNYGQEGLALKTYNSDLFNNWMNTEYIDGPNGISEVTKIDTSSGSFKIDELNMMQKVYKMLNRIAISGGSYDDWQSAVYDIDRMSSSESPMYMGGLIRNLVFQEVISNSRSIDQPLGTLAGRGTLGAKKKGGSVIIKATEMSYVMGIISITPNIDYSQGNKWDINLKTMDDFHKPQLDEIGFQNLTTDQMAWFDTAITGTGGTPTFKSAGKQPAWINYMTNVNVVKGNFAEQTQQMFMVLNRRYEANILPNVGIKDLTTYIDPSKFNHIFADTRRDAQNFWAQIAVNMHVRRKMSAKIMPNL